MIWVQKGLKITPTQNNIKPYTSALLTLIPKVQYVLSELKQKKKKLQSILKMQEKNLKIQSKWKSHLSKKQIWISVKCKIIRIKMLRALMKKILCKKQ